MVLKEKSDWSKALADTGIREELHRKEQEASARFWKWWLKYLMKNESPTTEGDDG